MSRSIVVADAQRLVRDGLHALIASIDGFVVVGEAENGRSAVAATLAEHPDVAVIDAQLPDPSGIEAIRELRRLGSRARCVVISSSNSAKLVRAALLAGASGFVPKTAPASELIDAIEAAASCQSFFVRSLGSCVAEALGHSEAAGAGRASELTDRQRQVLRLVAAGLSTREIAAELGVSIKTADTHRAKLMEKLDLHKASALVRYAIREGIVTA